MTTGNSLMDALEHSDLAAIRKYTILQVAAVTVRRRLSGMQTRSYD
jgi:hypothetical protein